MAELDYYADIKPIQNRYFDDTGLTTKFSGREREMLRNQYREDTARRLQTAEALLSVKRQQALAEREQQMLFDDAQKKRRQFEIDKKLGEATESLSAALRGETLADKALGVVDVQSRFAELAGTNPAFQTLLDAANRKIDILNRQQIAEEEARRASSRGAEKDPDTTIWKSDFSFVQGLKKEVPESGTFGATEQLVPVYSPSDIQTAKDIAVDYGLSFDDYEDEDAFISALRRKIRESGPASATRQEASVFDTAYGE